MWNSNALTNEQWPEQYIIGMLSCILPIAAVNFIAGKSCKNVFQTSHHKNHKNRNLDEFGQIKTSHAMWPNTNPSQSRSCSSLQQKIVRCTRACNTLYSYRDRSCVKAFPQAKGCVPANQNLRLPCNNTIRYDWLENTNCWQHWLLMYGIQPSRQSRVRFKATTYLSFSKNLAWSRKALIQATVSSGVCKTFHRFNHWERRPKCWSMSSWEWPLRKQPRDMLWTACEATKLVIHLMSIEFLHSLHVLSDWILMCRDGRCAPSRFSTVNVWLKSSMEVFESLWVSGGVTRNTTHQPWAMAAEMWRRGRTKLANSFDRMASCRGRLNLDWSMPSVTIVTDGMDRSRLSALAVQ